MSTLLNRLTRAFLFVYFLAAVSACNFPSGAPASTPASPDAIYTEAAQTVTARLTQNATPLVPTLVPTLPALTETTVPIPSPSSTSSPTPVETVTATPPGPTATPPSTDPKLSLGNPTWTDTFTDSKNWSLTEDDHTKMDIQDGSLVMTAKKAENWDGWTITWVKGANFYLEMTATPGDCSGLDHYGVVFRTTDDASKAYLFGFSCDGRYSFYLWDGEGFTRLIKWTASTAINQGSNQTNRLGVKAEGDQFSFYANGVLLDTNQDASFSEGHIGVFIGSANTTSFSVKVDELAFWELK